MGTFGLNKICDLKNETKLKYASNFSSVNREVELSGEAYFEVHHDAQHPFTVKIGTQKIKVLGTKFSVNANPEDQIIETSLISGQWFSKAIVKSMEIQNSDSIPDTVYCTTNRTTTFQRK